MAPKDNDYMEIFRQRVDEKKTQVSFPQLKYPSLRDEGWKDPVQWLTGKAMDDGAEGLWRVHNKLYDLSDFVNRHPGGSEWLELTQGTDITEAFECHHIDSIAETVLQKFYIRDVNTPRNSPFTFSDDGFFRSLKKAVKEELKKIPTRQVEKSSDRIIDGLFLCLLVSSALACWAKDYWVVMISYLTASLCLAWLVVAAHNYIHRRDNWRMYLFNLSLWSYRDFRIMHVLSHHLYPNTLMDLEMSGFEPLMMWFPRKKTWFTKMAFLNEIVCFPFVYIWNFIRRCILLPLTRKEFASKHLFWHDAIGLLLPLWMCLASGASVYDTTLMWMWIICTASAIFFHIGTNAAHYHPKCFKDGDQTENQTPDWAIHELEAVMDRRDINSNHFAIMTFFGNHTLHHLFPTLDHAVLTHLMPVFVEYCKKFRSNFRLVSSLDHLIGQIQMTLKQKPNLLEGHE